MSTMTAARPAASRPAAPAGSGVPTVAINPLKIVVQYRYWLIASVIIGGIVGVAAHLGFRAVSPLYRATTTYQALPPIADPLKPDVSTVDREEFERFVQTQTRIITSERLIRDAVVNDTSLPGTEWAKGHMAGGRLDPGTAVEDLKDLVRARVVAGTSLIEVSVTTRVPNDAKLIAEAVHRAYFKDLSASGKVRGTEQREPLNVELNSIGTEIRRIDSLIAQRQNERGITGGENDNTDAEYVRIYMLQPAIAEITQRFERARVRAATLEAQLKPGQAVTYTDEQRDEAERDPVLLGLKQRMAQIRTEMAAKEQSGLGAEHKEMVSLRKLAEQTEAELNGERERILRKLFDSEYDKVRQARDAAEAELKELTRQLNESIRRRQDIARAQTEIQLLKSDREKFVTRQAELRAAIAGIDVTAGLDRLERIGRVRRVEEAKTPDRLFFPRLEIMLPLGIIAIVGLTIGVIVLREIVDQRVKGPTDVSMIRGVRLLGIVPSADEDPSRPASVETAFRDSPTGAVSEGFRQVRGQLVKRLGQSGAKSLLVLSGAPGSGATSAVSNLAMGMAASDLKVLVIDANFRRPALHRVFKLAEGPGLGDVLMHKNTLDEAVQQTSVANLSLLAAGSGPSRAVPERLATETMSQIIKTAVARYDVVLVDTAPAMIAGEGLALANRCDAVCLVVRAFSEKRGLIARLRDQLADAKAEFLGVVVNGVRSASGGYLRKNIKAASDYQSGAAA
ncbi:MAG: polysaccharide biosynthesis tyrosine autokinase [Phycisphaeraceae bacterium]|nr:polysaccharide biosynthesis tyrosine autokinase [Phycisphaeraceae bacterium]